MENKKPMGYFFRVLAVILICVAVGYVILGYFVSTIDNDGEPRDGLGRLLDEVPGAFSMIMPHWAGFIWFFLDCIVIFILILIIDKLFLKSKVYLTKIKNVDF
jgi:hypothetical protein